MNVSAFPLALGLGLLLVSTGVTTGADIKDVRAGALTADGNHLTGLGRLPDGTVVVVNGRSTTAGVLRAQLRAAALQHLGPRKAFIGSGSSQKTTAAPHLTDQSVTVALAVVPTTGPRSPSTRVTPDPNYCEKNAPAIEHVKGSVTPGGYIVAEGLCLGASGSIKLIGAFPGGSLPLTVQSWASNSVTAAVPQVSGVYDQGVALQILAEPRKLSNEVNLQFTATRVIAALPSHFITNIACSAGNTQGANATSSCTAAAGTHWETDAGTDTWQAQLPTGWVLTSLELSTGYGSITGTAGFNPQPPSSQSWSVSWQSAIAATTTTDTVNWGFISSTTTDLTCASYSMTLYASGPDGTMPS